MGKMLKVLICFIFVFVLAGCQNDKSVIKVNLNNKDCIVYVNENKIVDNDNVYTYIISGNRIDITYPDSSSYWHVSYGDSSGSGWSDNYGNNGYISGEYIVDMLQKYVISENDHNWFGSLMFILLGLLSIVRPYDLWYLRYGFPYKDAKPSEEYIALTRFVGVILIVVGVFIF